MRAGHPLQPLRRSLPRPRHHRRPAHHLAACPRRPKCIGCGVCIARCPGLAIFVVDGSRPGDEGTIQLPYEAWPLPEPGESVHALDRAGRRVGTGTVEKVLSAKAQDHTAVVTVRVSKQLLNTVRAISVEGRAEA